MLRIFLSNSTWLKAYIGVILGFLKVSVYQKPNCSTGERLYGLSGQKLIPETITIGRNVTLKAAELALPYFIQIKVRVFLSCTWCVAANTRFGDLAG